MLYAYTGAFYMRNLNTPRFWYLWGSWSQSPMDTQGQLHKFGKSLNHMYQRSTEALSKNCYL